MLCLPCHCPALPSALQGPCLWLLLQQRRAGDPGLRGVPSTLYLPLCRMCRGYRAYLYWEQPGGSLGLCCSTIHMVWRVLGHVRMGLIQQRPRMWGGWSPLQACPSLPLLGVVCR